MLGITNNSIKHQSFLYTQLNDQTVLFQLIQFSMSFVYNRLKCQTVPLEPSIRHYQVLPLRAKLDLGVMAMKGPSTFLKATVLLEPHNQVV